jgi:LuxR family maltose regulon positive regulatory protein
MTRLIEIWMLQALAFQASPEPARALAALQRGLSLAEPHGFFQAWIDEGPPMARLLYDAVSRGIMPDYASRLLAAFPAASAPSKIRTSQISVQPAVGTEIAEPLSARELEVLELFAEGLTNREVATRLFLSLNTVKAHSRNIYGKLGVHSRTQAAARARALGILSS